jgi:hypothetical protein
MIAFSKVSKRIAQCSVFLIVTLASSAWSQQPSASPATAETAAVRQAVENYFRAADSGSPDAVRNTFHATGRMEGVVSGKIRSMTADEFAKRSFNGTPYADAYKLKRNIEWINVSGPGAVAYVVTKLEPATTYYDYFIMFKADGEWKIGLKAFANPANPANPAPK